MFQFRRVQTSRNHTPRSRLEGSYAVVPHAHLTRSSLHTAEALLCFIFLHQLSASPQFFVLLFIMPPRAAPAANQAANQANIDVVALLQQLATLQQQVAALSENQAVAGSVMAQNKLSDLQHEIQGKLGTLQQLGKTLHPHYTPIIKAIVEARKQLEPLVPDAAMPRV